MNKLPNIILEQIGYYVWRSHLDEANHEYHDNYKWQDDFFQRYDDFARIVPAHLKKKIISPNLRARGEIYKYVIFPRDEKRPYYTLKSPFR